MSITETRPDEADEAPQPRLAAPPPRPGVIQWITAADHKTVGISYLLTSLVFSVLAAVGIVGHRLELWGSGLQFVERSNPLALYTLALTCSFWLFLLPAFIGFATY